MLAEGSILDHVSDSPWPGCQIVIAGMRITWMSSAIASMLLVAVVLCVVLLLSRRRASVVPHGMQNAVEAVVVFVRDMVARPALHSREKMDRFLPFLLTLFFYILGMNLIGLLPLNGMSEFLFGRRLLGVTPTGVLTICAALASITLVTLIVCGCRQAARRYHENTGRPIALGLVLSPWLWFRSLSPRIPGATGIILRYPLAILEFIGAIAKCFSLMVRLAANIASGHILLAVIMMFTVDAFTAAFRDQATHVFYVGPLCVLFSVLVGLLELLVACLQAYIFTFLTAIFLGLYVESEH